MTFAELAKNRYSVRSFQQKQITEAELDQILETGRVAPSAHNNQPQRVFVARRREVLEKIASVCPCTFGAPTILVAGYDRTRQRMSKRNPGCGFGENDAAIVITHMMLQAADLGIGSCWVGMFNREEIHSALDLPEEVVVTGLLVLGYPAEDAKPLPLHSQYRPREETVEEL